MQRVDGATVNYGYDDIGQLTSAVGYEPDGVTQRANENLGYGYDAAGNLRSGKITPCFRVSKLIMPINW